jgi:undecaprenyl-diphosphatase
MRRLAQGWEQAKLWDESWCLRLNSTSGIPAVRLLFSCVSRLGDGVFWYALMAVMVALYGESALEPVLCMLAVGTTGLAIYKVLKRTTSRPRPYQVQTRIRLGAAPLDRFSFPSGHTLHAVSLSIVAIAYFPYMASLLLPFALLVAASRVVLGLHYPSDVLAGACIGAGLASGALSAL